MAHDRDTLRAVAWQEILPGLHVLSALRMAMNVRLLVMAAIAIIGTAAGWRVIGGLFDGTTDPNLQKQIELSRVAWPWDTTIRQMPLGELLSVEGWRYQSPLIRAWGEIAMPFKRIFEADVSLVEWTYWLTCAAWALVVWAFFGGVITRTAAVAFARQENLAWGKTAGFVRSHMLSYVTAPLMPIVATFGGAAFMAVVGAMMRAEFGLLVAGVVWPLVLLGGFMMAFLLIGLYFSWPLMWAAISAEGTDAFGALSHAYAYVVQRPLRYFQYAVLAAIAGVLGWFLVSEFAYWIIKLSEWGASWGSGVDQIKAVAAGSDMGTLGNVGVKLIHFWQNCVTMLALAFIFSYFWVATTVIYFLLRRLVDAKEIDEVYLADEQELHGLPPLETGPDGVVEPADNNAAGDHIADENAAGDGDRP